MNVSSSGGQFGPVLGGQFDSVKVVKLNRSGMVKFIGFSTLEYEYQQLSLPFKMIPTILESKLEYLIIQNKLEEAENLLSKAESYHKFGSVTELQLIKELRLRISKKDDIELLQGYYNRIFACPPEKLIRVFPDKLKNGKQDIFEFITSEVVLAVSKMLKKIKSIEAINDENKYTNLIQILLQMRMSQWGWSITSQDSGGVSESGKNGGETDLEILNSNSIPIITCEAFILRNPKRVQEHLEKLIGKYTHARKSLITIVYFLGKHSDFKSEWKKYCETTIPKLTYPVGYELKGDKVTDRTIDFGCDETGIRVGYALHGENTSVYHVFVNINYFVS